MRKQRSVVMAEGVKITKNVAESTHTVHIDKRRHMKIEGVLEVIGFDGGYVELITSCGRLMIDGEDIKIGVLDTDAGVVELDGNILSVEYVEDAEREKRGFFKRLRG